MMMFSSSDLKDYSLQIVVIINLGEKTKQSPGLGRFLFSITKDSDIKYETPLIFWNKMPNTVRRIPPALICCQPHLMLLDTILQVG